MHASAFVQSKNYEKRNIRVVSVELWYNSQQSTIYDTDIIKTWWVAASVD